MRYLATVLRGTPQAWEQPGLLMLAMLARKQSEFDNYARDSDLANQASGAKDPSEESMAKVIVMEEKKRLGINESDLNIQISKDENLTLYEFLKDLVRIDFENLQ